MKFQLPCRSDFYDAKESIGGSLHGRVTFDVDTLTILGHDEDADACIEATLDDLGIDTSEHIPGEDMDGDAGSALASAGFGTDEDYEHNSYDEGGE